MAFNAGGKMKLIDKLNDLCARSGFLPPILSRFVIGFVFVQSGWGKLHHLEKVIVFFQSLGIPMAQLQAPFVAGMEFVCGTLVLIGFLTRLASVPLIAIMMVAILTAKRADIAELSDLFAIYEFVYIIVLSWLVTEGPGRFSVDALVFRKKRR